MGVLRSPWFVGVLAVLLVGLVLLIGYGLTASPRDSHSYEFVAVQDSDRRVIVVNETIREEAPDLVRGLEHAAEEGRWTARSFQLRKQLYETIWMTGSGGVFDVAFDVDGHLVQVESDHIVN